MSILLFKGYIELDPFVAEVNLQRCSGQGLCIAECPIEGAILMPTSEVLRYISGLKKYSRLVEGVKEDDYFKYKLAK